MCAKAQDKKDKLIAELIEIRRKILDAASALSPVGQSQVFLGIWSIKDLLAHLVGWDVANLKAIKAIRAGKLPDFYAYQDRDWKTYNARLVLRYKKNDFGKLASSAKASHEKLIDFLETLPAEEFDQDKGVRFKGYKVTIASLLQVELKDEKVHHTQIEAFNLKLSAFL
jgi:uncharacterized damage-inducible protein DinB